jgi:serine/threonine-protein kinase RsbT
VSKENQRMSAGVGMGLNVDGRSSTAAGETRIPIGSDLDIIRARQTGRNEASKLGFSSTDLTLLATAISELARNIVMYAREGEIVLQIVQNSEKQGIVVIARDHGPGIADVRQALQDGFSTSRSLGLGLPGVRRLVDEFEIESDVGKGTIVTVKKWMQR